MMMTCGLQRTKSTILRAQTLLASRRCWPRLTSSRLASTRQCAAKQTRQRARLQSRLAGGGGRGSDKSIMSQLRAPNRTRADRSSLLCSSYPASHCSASRPSRRIYAAPPRPSATPTARGRDASTWRTTTTAVRVYRLVCIHSRGVSFFLPARLDSSRTTKLTSSGVPWQGRRCEHQARLILQRRFFSASLKVITVV